MDGIYYTASELSVLEVDVLDAGNMGKLMDLSNAATLQKLF